MQHFTMVWSRIVSGLNGHGGDGVVLVFSLGHDLLDVILEINEDGERVDVIYDLHMGEG